MLTADRIRPIVTMTGSHQRTCCVFNALCIDGGQFFRQYDSFNQYTFLEYLTGVQKRFEATEHGKLEAAAGLLNEQDQMDCFKVK